MKGAGIEREVLAVLRGYAGAFAIHSFDHALIARLHRAAADVRLGVLFEGHAPDLDELLERTGARDVWPHVPLATAVLTNQAHALGARVIPWTVNAPAEVQRLVGVGVDGLCGDDVRIFPTR